MRHYAIRMFFYIIKTLKIALSLFCMTQKLFSFFTMQRWYSFNCCCHNLNLL